MAEKRARRDVKRLSAKVDAFIRKVDKRPSVHAKHHTKPRPAHQVHHEHHASHHQHRPHSATAAHHHSPHVAHHEHHTSHEHAHEHHPTPPHHEHPKQNHESHHHASHHESHHQQHKRPEHHASPHPVRHMQPHEHSRETEDHASEEEAIHAAVVAENPPAAELPPMPIPPQKKALVEHMEHKAHHKNHATQTVKIKKTFPVSHSRPELRNERDIAVKFASQVHKKFTNIIKATVLFGSQAKKTAVASSDIDIVIIVDDASLNWDLELIAWYREELGKLVAANKYAHELHVNTIKLTTWWQDLINGDPVVLNILRYGEPLIDIAGFFKPLKSLLQQGKIHSTPESVYNALQRAPMHLSRSRASELGAIEGVYWTMVDSAQAALITAGQLPPSPEHMTAMLKETFVDKGLMKGDFVYWYRDCFALHKAIIHGHVTSLKGADIDVWQGRAEQFMKKMTEIIDHLLSTK